MHLYELKNLEKDWNYYDFKICVGEENEFCSYQQTSIFKIPIDLNASLLTFHQEVYRHLIFGKQESNLNQ